MKIFSRSRLKIFFSLLPLMLLLSCGSDDQDDPGAGQKVTTAVMTATSCSDILLYGTIERNTPLTEANYFSATVNVSKVGTYFYETAETNGYKFVASGSFTETGEHELRFTGEGIPGLAQKDMVTLAFGNATCSKEVTVYEENFPNPDSTVIISAGEPFFSDYYYTYAHDGHGHLLWKRQGLSPVAAIDGEVAYLILADELHAVDLATGKTVWGTSLGLSINQQAVTMDENNIYLTGSGKVVSISKETGLSNWDYVLGNISYVIEAPSVAEGKVYAAYTSSLFCLDLDGNLVWEYPMERSIRSNPAIVDGIVYVGNDNGYLYAINTQDTSTVWSYHVGVRGEESPTIADGKVYIQGESRLYCLDALDGDSLWSYKVVEGETDWSSPTVANGIVYAAGFGKGVMAFDATTGEELWHNTSPAQSADKAPTVLGSLLIGGGANGLAAINAISGATLWKYGTLDPWHPNDNVTFYTPAVIYNRETGEVAYPSVSGHKH